MRSQPEAHFQQLRLHQLLFHILPGDPVLFATKGEGLEGGRSREGIFHKGTLAALP